MKHILKVASLENLPNTRPLIAMDNNGDLKLLAKVTPSIEMVDLGLPSGILWAKYNVGATPGETAESYYGDYYAWGELETKSDYSWSTYEFGASSPFSKYDKDGKTVLEAENDVATATYGEGYRMPTKTEIDELRKLSNKWVTNYNNISGLNGRVFTGNNGNTLFIPAADCCEGQSNAPRAGSGCRLWSSSLNTDPQYTQYAWYLTFNTSRANTVCEYRCLGQSVRAVRVVN